MSDIQVGDVVYLKSGGPAMTVNAPTPLGVVCTWFFNEEHKSATFSRNALTKENPNPSKKPAA